MFTLGESIIVTGTTVSVMDFTVITFVLFASAFFTMVAMWWLYFNRAVAMSSHAISTSDDPGRLARSAFTYGHIPIIAGILVSAVAHEIALTHPHGDVDSATVAVMLLSSGLFLAGHGLFTWLCTNLALWSRLLGIILLALLWGISGLFSPLGLAFASAGVVLVVAIWETYAVRRASTTNQPGRGHARA